MEGGRKTWSDVAVLSRWAYILNVFWNQEILIRNQIIASGLARICYLSRGDQHGIGKTSDNQKQCQPPCPVLSSIIPMEWMNTAIIPSSQGLELMKEVVNRFSAFVAQSKNSKTQIKPKQKKPKPNSPVEKKNPGFKYLHRLLGNKSLVLFIKTMSSHRIYFVFVLGVNGSPPQWLVCGKKQWEMCCIVHCMLLLRHWERWSCQKLRLEAGIKLWLLQHMKCIRWDLMMLVVVHVRPLLCGVIHTRTTWCSWIMTDGCRPVSLVSGH